MYIHTCTYTSADLQTYPGRLNTFPLFYEDILHEDFWGKDDFIYMHLHSQSKAKPPIPAKASSTRKT